jgi:lipid-A-disaccharide synthase
VSGELLRVGMVAGEASGDLLGAHLIAALKARRPGMLFAGIGGPRMLAEGFETLYPMEKLSVRGYAEVLRNYAEIMGIRRRLAKALIGERPDLFIGVDSGDFNLGLERRLRNAGIPTIHYVSPSVWAWRGWRVKRIARSVSRILVMFPFEAPLYEKAGVPVTYVGHPLADVIPQQPSKQEARDALRLPAKKLIVALLPGSRRSELHYMASAFVLAAHRFRQEMSEVHFVVPMVTRATRDMFEAALHHRFSQKALDCFLARSRGTHALDRHIARDLLVTRRHHFAHAAFADPTTEAIAPSVVPAATVTPTGTQLNITSQPEGARVTVDGIGWGVTPVTIRHLAEGAKRVRVTNDGYAAGERVVQVTADRASRVTFQLKALSEAVEPVR